MKYLNTKNYAHYRHICFASERSTVDYWCSHMLGKVNHRYIKQVPVGFLSQRICAVDPLDLLVLDSESIGPEQMDYFIFITKCIKPGLPVVVIGDAQIIRQRLSHAGEILDVIDTPQPIQNL